MWLFPTILVALFGLFYGWFKWRHNYWTRMRIGTIPPVIPGGNFPNLLSESAGVAFAKGYEAFKKRGLSYGGLYVITTPVFIPVDLDLIKNIMTRDFNHFVEKDFYFNETDQPISAHLFSIGGEKWRVLRQKLTPTFTSGKMKMMFGTLVDCRGPLLKELRNSLKMGEAIDVKEVAGKFTTDIIGSVAFGINCNSFENPNAEFRKHGKNIFEMSVWIAIKQFFMFSFQTLARSLHMVPLPQDSSDFFTKVVMETIAFREKSGTVRNDFMQLLMNIKDKGDGHSDDLLSKITVNELIAQAFVFFVAGFETSSTTITFCMFELAKNQDIQDKVRAEIHAVLQKHNGEITYEAIGEMTYMKQVVDETLRKYPPLPTLDRKCTKDYKLPNSDNILKSGIGVTISTLGLQRDPDNFPNPDKFDPERFSAENVGNIKPFTYMPFGEGPRVCIGLRFGIMQTKVGLLTLLKDFRYKLNAKTKPELDIGLGFVLTPREDILLDIERVEG